MPPRGAPAPAPHFALPFPAGERRQLIQGDRDGSTHTGTHQFAYDFAMPEESPVVAAAPGVVVEVRQDSIQGGASPEMAEWANVIVVDHGNCRFSNYVHLAPRSAVVREGDLVGRGQMLARSGRTGQTSAPHLHFEVVDALAHSMPVVFREASEGLLAGAWYYSANGPEPAEPVVESRLPRDLYAANNVVLDVDLPAYRYRTGERYPFHGHLADPSKRGNGYAVLFVTRRGRPTEIELVFLAAIANDGSFATDFWFDDLVEPTRLLGRWSTDTANSNRYELGITVAAEDETYRSEISTPITVR